MSPETALIAGLSAGLGIAVGAGATYLALLYFFARDHL